MPGNEVENGIRKLDSIYQSVHLSSPVDIGWRVLSGRDELIKKEAGPLNNFDLNLKDYSVQQRGTEYSRYISGQQLNASCFALANQQFQVAQNQQGLLYQNTGYNQLSLGSSGLFVPEPQQENDPWDSLTLTTSFERSEITKAYTQYSLSKGKNNQFSGQDSGCSQPSLMQQSEYNDMQLLQQHMMFKKLQDLQRQQQLQQLGDVGQQSSLNQLSAIGKQAGGGQFSPLINGTPVRDTSEMYMNWMQRGTSPTAQGVSNSSMFPQAQGLALHSMGLAPQQHDVSLYGTPVASARSNMNQYSHLQGMAQDSTTLSTKTAGLAQKSLLQSSEFSHPFLNEHYTLPQDQVRMSPGASINNQEFQGKKLFGPGSAHGLSAETVTRNPPPLNTPQMSGSTKDFHRKHAGAGWPETQQKSTQLGSSPGLVPLDPMEEKILYNMDDTPWGASFGRHPEMVSGGFRNALENPDISNAFPSVQSGGWTALMQSAVAEASSSDTGPHEEWSGLTFQNTEPSADNQVSNFIESDKHHAGWADSKLPSSSFSSKPPVLVDSTLDAGLSSFQQSDKQVSDEQRKGFYQDGTLESFESSPQVTGEWVDRNPQQNPSVEGCQHVQSYMHSSDARAGQMYEHSTGILQQVQSGKEISRFSREDTPMCNSAPKVQHITGQQALNKNQSNEKKGSDNIGNNDPRALGCSYEENTEGYEKQGSYYPKETSSDNHNHSESSGHEQGNSSQGPSNDSKGKYKALDKKPSNDDYISADSSGLNISAQKSQNMLELIHKVDQSSEDGLSNFSEVPNIIAPIYNQSSVPQGFGLKLAPPSQWLPNSNRILSQGSPQIPSYLSSKKVDVKLRGGNQSWTGPQLSIHSLPPSSHELSQWAHWDSGSGTPGQMATSSPFSVHGNSVVAHVNRQSQMQAIPDEPHASESSQAMMRSSRSINPPFDHTNFQVSRENSTNLFSKQLPVFETVPESQPSRVQDMSQQVESSASPHNVWATVPGWQHPSSLEPPKAASLDPSENSILNPTKVQKVSHDVFDSAQTTVFSHEKEPLKNHIPDANAAPSGSHTPLHAPDGVRPADRYAQAASEKDIDPIAPSSLSPRHLDQNHVLLSQTHGAEADLSRKSLRTDNIPETQQVTSSAGQKSFEHNSGLRNPMDSVLNSPPQLNSFPTQDRKPQSFTREAKEDQMVKASSLNYFHDSQSSMMVGYEGQNDFQNQSSRRGMTPSHSEHGQVNVAPAVLTQYGAFRKGQVMPTHDSRLQSSQFSVGNSFQNLPTNTYVEHLGHAVSSQATSVMPSKVSSFLPSKQVSSPLALPLDMEKQNMVILRAKKRKSMTSDQLAWHKEVKLGSKGPPAISMAEQEWLQVTNRLCEKMVEKKAQSVEDLRTFLRSKRRRLVLTTQVLQELFRPTPKSVLSAHSASHYEDVSYYVSRAALGDACSLANYSRTSLLPPLEKSNLISETLNTSEESGCRKYSKLVEEFIWRTKTMESDFKRLDKVTSIVDIGVESFECERFSVINRLAMFHSRGRVSTSPNSSSSVNPRPQRYVSVLHMPRNLQDTAECFTM